jgi:hypothetical protein
MMATGRGRAWVSGGFVDPPERVEYLIKKNRGGVFFLIKYWRGHFLKICRHVAIKDS